MYLPHFRAAKRNNEDEGRTNPYGMKLLDLCRRCSLFIANSRRLNDKYIGRTTCKDINTVYYLIMYPLLFEYVNEFTVCDFNLGCSQYKNTVQ